MRINGRDALSSVESAISGVRTNESRLTGVLSSAAAEAERLRFDLAESFKALALVRLDALVRNQVVGGLDAAERRALDLMRSHKAKLDQILVRFGGAQSALVAAEEEHRQRMVSVADAREPIASLQARVEAEMSSDPAWLAQKAVVDKAIEIANAAEEKAKISEADRDEKRRPYEADPLFMYLWDKRFGTSAYGASNIVRYFDRKVANLVGYDAARPNYTLLNEIPERLREHAMAALAKARAEDETLEQIERAALVRAGIQPLEAVLSERLAALKETSDRLSATQKAMTTLDEERARLQSDGDRRAHEEALAVLTQALSQESLQTMYQEARQTATPEDDRLVQKIELTQTAIARAEADVARIRDEAREVARRRGELESVRDRMRSRRYDRHNSQFELDGGDVLGGLIGGILGGVLQSRDLWEALEKAHRKRRDWDYDWDYGDDDRDDDDDDDDDDKRGRPWGSKRHHPKFRFPSSSVPRMPKGFGGGGFKTGGGFKGGGFKTGGRF
jgi:hypothetical protein